VDLDQITAANVGSLNEVCEIRLNEPIPFSTGILKVGRTLYVNTARFTVALDAATCAKRWQYTVQFVASTIGYNRGTSRATISAPALLESAAMPSRTGRRRQS